MNRLRTFELTANEKAYLAEKAVNGVCASVNDHECYLGMNLIIYSFTEMTQIYTYNCDLGSVGSWVSLESLNSRLNF